MITLGDMLYQAVGASQIRSPLRIPARVKAPRRDLLRRL
jgi:hypothetical protein